ncbi:hypothetical protein [Hymenobacter ruricola]|uniref:Uncharacterized protein n=1 Tax=Hymenobacter ruricola TaxID=2791023 RepID=A0ABS0I590_9BACT|nr:hypothetical protein [Hymenobacter ruricola]MBF9222131.1 hypothetical protein [Hymenobacter ruricola]
MDTSSSMRQILIPLKPERLGGPFATAEAEILSEKNGRGIARVTDFNQSISWVNEFELMIFQTLNDGINLKAIRKASEEEIKNYRVPIWIQSEEVPECCGKPMIFIGQLDDDTLCAEPPPNAKMWWHDAASFYVFTCPVCLSVQAVGQQF